MRVDGKRRQPAAPRRATGQSQINFPPQELLVGDSVEGAKSEGSTLRLSFGMTYFFHSGE